MKLLVIPFLYEYPSNLAHAGGLRLCSPRLLFLWALCAIYEQLELAYEDTLEDVLELLKIRFH
jgi:hypothetical protein